MTTTNLPQPVIVPRRLTGAVIAHLNLPRNPLGRALVTAAPDAATQAQVAAWWNARAAAEQQVLRDSIALLAAPQLLADLRACYQQKSQVRTWALAGGAAADAPWLFCAPVREDGDYHAQPVPGRAAVVDSFAGYLQAGSPVWESGIRFRCPVAEFALLLALADVYTRAQYAALLLHQPYPGALLLDHVRQGCADVLQCGDQRFLFPAVAHLLPETVRQATAEQLLAPAGALVKRGLLVQEKETLGWTDGGRFFADSLHHRTCALALDIAGVLPDGKLATQGALFIRGDQVLWYCDIEPGAEGTVTVVSVGAEQARGILDELLTPVTGGTAARQ